MGAAWGIGGTVLCAIAEPCGAIEASVAVLGGIIGLGGLFGSMLFGGSGGYSVTSTLIWDFDEAAPEYYYHLNYARRGTRWCLAES